LRSVNRGDRFPPDEQLQGNDRRDRDSLRKPPVADSLTNPRLAYARRRCFFACGPNTGTRVAIPPKVILGFVVSFTANTAIVERVPFAARIERMAPGVRVNFLNNDGTANTEAPHAMVKSAANVTNPNFITDPKASLHRAIPRYDAPSTSMMSHISRSRSTIATAIILSSPRSAHPSARSAGVQLDVASNGTFWL